MSNKGDNSMARQVQVEQSLARPARQVQVGQSLPRPSLAAPDVSRQEVSKHSNNATLQGTQHYAGKTCEEARSFAKLNPPSYEKVPEDETELSITSIRTKDLFRNMPKLLTYNGKSSWLAFKEKFVSFKDTFHLTEAQCRLALCYSLYDKAAEYHAILRKENPEYEFETLMCQLEKRFHADDLPATALAKFQIATQAQDESLKEWAERVLNLASHAFQKGIHVSEEFMGRQLVMRFCQGLCDRQACQHVMMCSYQSLNSALDEVRIFQQCRIATYGKLGKPGKKDQKTGQQEDITDVQVQAVQQNATTNYRGRGNNRNRGNGSDRSSEDPESWRSSVDSKMDKLQVQLETMATSLASLTSRNSGRGRWSGKRGRGSLRGRGGPPNVERFPKGTCFNCGAEDHFKYDCPSLKVSSENDELNTKGSNSKASPRPTDDKASDK